MLALAAEFDGSGAMVLAAKQATTPRQRRLAMLYTSPTDPAFRPLRRLIDAILLADPDLVATKHGLFTKAELAAVGATVERNEGQELWVFPVAYRNGSAVYRPASQRGAQTASFRMGLGAEPTERRREWWEEAEEGHE